MAYRDLDDVDRMLDAAAFPGAKAVVIGGGLLGLEAAAGLRLRGMEVVVLHVMGHLMERQLDPSAGYLLQKDLERRGIKVHCKAQTKAILGQNRVEAVLLEDGTVYDADIVVMAVGIRPETRIATRRRARDRPRHRRRRRMRTSDPAHPLDRRMRRARRHRLRPRRAALRPGQGGRRRRCSARRPPSRRSSSRPSSR